MPLRYFYSRPRVGGDYILQRCEMANAISTHAPAWGATCPKRSAIPNCHISTHAPAWGATIKKLSKRTGVTNFYSRPRVGGDIELINTIESVNYFYSRPRVGGDSDFSRDDFLGMIFLLTPPRGGRQSKHGTGGLTMAISTHAPAWGATELITSTINRSTNFYSRPRVGGDLFVMLPLPLFLLIFLLTPPRGGRRQWPQSSGSWAAFLLTPPRGGRRQFFTSTRQVCDTNCRKIHSNSNFLSICPCDF